MSEQEDHERWQREENERKAREGQPSVEPMAITPGTAILATATIDSLFSALFATRSADLVAAGTPTYSWGKDNMIIAQWPAIQNAGTPAQPNYSAMFCRFEARSVMGSQIAQ